MNPEDLKYPALFHAGVAYFLRPADRHTGSYFGGPFGGVVAFRGRKVSGLHHVATITGNCFAPLREVTGDSTVRLLYGLRYDGCKLKYQNGTDIRVLSLSPARPTRDWPYAPYPMQLPYVPLTLQKKVACSLEEFLEVSVQPLELAEQAVLVIVPPIPTLGVSLWGPSGDLENVQIVFRFDLHGGMIEGFNQCG